MIEKKKKEKPKRRKDHEKKKKMFRRQKQAHRGPKNQKRSFEERISKKQRKEEKISPHRGLVGVKAVGGQKNRGHRGSEEASCGRGKAALTEAWRGVAEASGVVSGTDLRRKMDRGQGVWFGSWQRT